MAGTLTGLLYRNQPIPDTVSHELHHKKARWITKLRWRKLRRHHQLFTSRLHPSHHQPESKHTTKALRPETSLHLPLHRHCYTRIAHARMKMTNENDVLAWMKGERVERRNQYAGVVGEIAGDKSAQNQPPDPALLSLAHETPIPN